MVWFDFFAWFVGSVLFAQQMQVRIPKVSRSASEVTLSFRPKKSNQALVVWFDFFFSTVLRYI